jgi:enoyl-CoA hydratase/carnithine racemase
MTTDTHSPINLRLDGAIATLVLNRPERHNALGGDDLALFEDRLDEVADAADVRVLVLSGGAAKSFCSGVSIGDIDSSHWKAGPLERLVARLEAVEVPVIAALNGGVYGGGIEIALACDFRIGVEGMRAFVPPARLGIHYPVSGLERYVQRLGLNAAKRFLLAVEEMDAAELHRIGFLDRVVARDALDATVDALARRIAALAPLAVQGMKTALNEIARGDLDQEAAAERIGRCWVSDDHAEGKRAFAEKRPPVFVGR